MTQQETGGVPRARRGWKILLVASLALNLLFIGLIGGAMMRFGLPGGHAGADRARAVSLGTAVFSALPRDDRRAMFRTMRGASDGAGRGLRDGAAGEAESLLAALRAEPPDSAALAAFADAQAERRRAHGRAIAEAWVARVAAMSVEERRAYADRVEDILNRPHREGHRGMPGTPD